MQSPFPGMNPYLEQPDGWLDFHNTFLLKLREVLAPQLRPRYVVRAEHHLYLYESPAPHTPLARPDIVVDENRTVGQLVNTAATTDLVAPAAVQVPVFGDEIHSVYLEVRKPEGGEVVTTIELLSPSNKATGPDREAYWAKIRRVIRSSANFVEIDLLRGGPRMPWAGLPACDYYALVSRADTRPQADVWPVRLRDRLPEIPIPVRPGEPGGRVDLQALLHHVYDTAGFGDSIYYGEPDPRLSPADAAWAESLVPKR